MIKIIRIFLVFVIALTASCDGNLLKSGYLLGPKSRGAIGGREAKSGAVPVGQPTPSAAATRSSPQPTSVPLLGPAPSALEKRESAAKEKAETVLGTGVFIEEATTEAATGRAQAGGITMKFVDAQIADVVRSVLGTMLKLNYAIDPQVKGTITLQTASPISRQAILPTLESVLRMNGVAIVRSGGLYRVMPVESAARGAPASSVAGLGGDRRRAFGMDIIPLKFISAHEFGKILESMAPAGVVRRVDEARNVIIVAGTQSERADVGELVSIFDVDWLAGMSFALVPLRQAQASDIIPDLERVFGAGAKGPLAGLVRFSAVERRNSVLVISSRPDYVERAKSWISRLDIGDADEKQLFVYYVQNARATDLATILTQVFSSSGTGLPSSLLAPGSEPVRLSSRATPSSASRQEETRSTQRRPAVSANAIGPVLEANQTSVPTRSVPPPKPKVTPGVSAAIEKLRLTVVPDDADARIIADDVNNALVVLARPRTYRMIEAALHKLDIVPTQVLIEATIVEVTLNDQLRYGVQWFFKAGDSKAVLSRFARGAASSVFPGFSYVYRGGDAQVVLNALDSVTDVRVVSSPQVMVLDNRTAELQVGDQVPISTQQSISNTDPNAPTVNTIQFRDTGVVLRVTPRVNSSGQVTLEIEQEESNAVATTTSGIDSPTIQQRRVRSSVAVRSGETIALGGLIRNNRSDTESGVPVLSAIPILGNLFRDNSSSGRRTELLALITPRVVRNEEEARKVTEDLRQSLHRASELYRTGRGGR